MPGVTITHSGPSATLSVRISRGDATQPSSPASRARSARWSTCASTLEVTPTSRWSARRSRLVSTVTPRTSGRGTAKSAAAFAAAGGAHHGDALARVDVEHEHPEARGLAHRARDRGRDVEVLEVEEDAEAALARHLDRGGPGGREELRADLAAEIG